EEPVGVAPEARREGPLRAGPELRELAGDERAERDAATQLDRAAGLQPDDRRERDIGPRSAVERPLEVEVRRVEGLVAPVEAAAALGRPGEHRDEDRPEQRILAGLGE